MADTQQQTQVRDIRTSRLTLRDCFDNHVSMRCCRLICRCGQQSSGAAGQEAHGRHGGCCSGEVPGAEAGQVAVARGSRCKTGSERKNVQYVRLCVAQTMRQVEGGCRAGAVPCLYLPLQAGQAGTAWIGSFKHRMCHSLLFCAEA